MTTEFQDRLIQTALRKGYLDEGSVQTALQRLAEARSSGGAVRLHQLLVDMGFLTREQLLDVRRTMTREGVYPRLDEYYVVARIGRGSMGTVYRAHDRALDRPVALKVLASHLAADPQFVERFLKEARLAARISHPNVVQVFDVGQWRGTHYIVMEHVEGRTLEQMVTTGGPLSETEAIRIGVQMARALGSAAAKGVVHRDIKPGNILVRPDGTAKLSDLGLALSGGESTQSAVGTPYYMSPEQARGSSELDTRSDLYSLGCSLYFAVTGHHPFEGASAYETLRMHAESARPDARALRPEISARFAAVLKRLMAVRPEGRYGAPEELSDALEAMAAPAGRTKPAERWLWAVGILLAIVAVALMVLAAMVILGGGCAGARALDSGPAALGRWDGRGL